MIKVESLSDLPEHGITSVSIACGTFDGVHVGHQAILGAAVETAGRTGATPVVLTFSPHPRAIVQPDNCPPLLISEEHKQRVISRSGIGATITIPFTRELAGLGAHDFLRTFLLADDVHTSTICVGSGWRFGHKAAGTVDCLRQAGEQYGFDVVGVDEVADDMGTISSTRIRNAIMGGDLAECEALLGRPFSICGEVGRGKGIASRELNYPTANIMAGNGAYPPAGIYAATAIMTEDNDRRLPGVCYLGYSPTFVEEKPETPFVEMHVFDFSGDLYGQLLEVEFNHFIRPDAHFPDKASLLDQIKDDVQKVRAWQAAEKNTGSQLNRM